MVIVLEQLLLAGGVHDIGEKLAVAPYGSPDELKVIGLLKPF
jgi:hypothetical protein